MMTILIPGLILVALMIWASTRIKKSAAEAYEREQIETPEFSLTKPPGLLSIADPPDGLLFSAYSKDFGVGEAGRIRRATAQLSRYPNGRMEEAAGKAKAEATEVISELNGVIGGRKWVSIVVEQLEQGIPLESHYKIISGPGSIYQLVVSILPEYKDEMQPGIDELLSSFTLA